MANETFIKRVKLEGYKSIRSAEIGFQPGLNVIIGKNGGGKTNFLEFLNNIVSLSILRQSLNDWLVFRFKFCSWVVNLKDKSMELSISRYAYNEEIINVKVDGDKKEFIRNTDEGIQIPFLDAGGDYIYKSGYRLNSELIKFSLPENIILLDIPQHITFTQKTFDINYRNSGSTTLFVHIFLRLLQGKLFNTVLDKLDGFLFDNFISEWNEYHEIDELNRSLRAFSPIQEMRISYNGDKYQGDTIFMENIQIEFNINGEWLIWQFLSDGTKKIFHIISTVLLCDDTKILLIEEPELGIHPHQLHLLMTFLKEQSENKQIILTTHSPQVLNILNKDELDRIIICEMTGNGTKLRHLDEKQKAKARKYMEQDSFLSDYWLYSDLEPHTP